MLEVARPLHLSFTLSVSCAMSTRSLIFEWELAALFPTPQHRLLAAVSFFQWSPGGELSMELPHVPGAPHVPPGTVPPDEAQVGTGFYVGGLQIRHFDPNPVTPHR